MERRQIITLLLLVFAFIATPGCKKNASCFDEEMYRQHKNDICTADCPGVKGCDGKTYCNECIANSKGIRVVQ